MKTYSIRFIFIQIMTLFALALFLSLGMWQMSRGNVKSDIEKANVQNQSSSIDVQLPLSDVHEWRYRAVNFFGVYDSNKQFLLDNQVRDGVTGYNVMTPAKVNQRGQNYWILVDRGWIPQAARREQMPNIQINQTDDASIVGRIYVPYAKAYSLGGIADGEDSGWPRRIQFVDYHLLSDRLGVALEPFTLRLDMDQKHGYRRDWNEYNMSAQKHYGYAFQWFAMALAIVVLWWLYCLKPLLNNK